MNLIRSMLIASLAMVFLVGCAEKDPTILHPEVAVVSGIDADAAEDHEEPTSGCVRLFGLGPIA